ncbi:YgiQ family radical SAM protein [Anaeroarcus burkinensis]|uniref:YgiQ family radical SAM protein n=1 Tax=Anaeroarcus burkinensis TaxID=82376 RepID=UPI000416C433|nr:YgiQ family radical SAM protein [Anaeroarcus burkinensis]
MEKNFLPVCRADMEARGWDYVDFLFISGDAYVDHPSFGHAIISRWLEKQGYRVAILAQPDWRSVNAFKEFGKPRLGVLVSAGNLDSMLNKYTAAKRLRSEDRYAPGGKASFRPDRATLVYCSRIREIWKDIPLIIGGIEASLRRFVHYDYWENSLRRSILADSHADILIYGMGERQISEIAKQLESGIPISQIRQVPGTCFLVEAQEEVWDAVKLPSWEECRQDPKAFAKAGGLQFLEQDPIRGKTLLQEQERGFLVQNPPAMPLTTAELDAVYDLPYMRTWHPSYDQAGGVPAIEEVQFSLVSQRGCFGGCAFCAITSHQGRIIQSRSHESLLKEARLLTTLPEFKGYIHDVGGPTANFRQPACAAQLERGACRGKSCLSPQPCAHLQADHQDYLRLLRSLRQLPGIKKVFIRSGIRYDYLLLAKDRDEFLRELCQHHVSGQLKVAPEHVAPKVTRIMGKSSKDCYLRFQDAYRRVNRELGKEQYLVPYLMSSHPGCGLAEAVELAEFLRDQGYHPEQVQDFIPTPGSLSTCMYYSGIHPLTGQSVKVCRDIHEKKLQRALLQFRNPKNRALVHEALLKARRQDLVGYESRCLLRPLPGETQASPAGRQGKDSRAKGGHRGAGVRQSGKTAKDSLRNQRAKSSRHSGDKR